MGGWDSYCAFCCAPLVSDLVECGDDDPKMLEKRREIVRRNRSWDDDTTSEFPDSDPGDSEFDWEEQRKYDPDKIDLQEIAWMDRCRALGFNPSASGLIKAYVSGQGKPTDPGWFQIDRPGNDPNDPGSEEVVMYHSYNQDDMVGYPFHETCYDIFAKNLGCMNKQEIDKDVLYTAMSQKCGADDSALQLDYGCIEGKDQYWSCAMGYEYVVCDPGPKPELPAILQSLVPENLFTESEPLALEHKVRDDPLIVLPYDVLYSVMEYLPISSTLKLAQASWHVFTLTRQDAFWKSMTRRHLLPWLWELSDLPSDTNLVDFLNTQNAKNIFLWLDKSTEGKFGIEGPLMGLANRRRIWKACGDLAIDYKRLVGIWTMSFPNNEEATTILGDSVCLHMPAVLDPLPHGQTIATQFIDSWTDLQQRSCQLDTYWTSSQALAGITLRFGDQERVFGVAEGEKGCAVKMAPGEWIREIRAGTRAMELPEENKEDSSTHRSAITHLVVVLTSGRLVTVQSYEWVNTRAFSVLPGMHLVGLAGQIAPNGIVSRLGLLQAPRQGRRPSNQPSYTAIQKALHSNASSHESTRMTDKLPWERSDIRVEEVECGRRETTSHRDMVPLELFQWVMDPEEYKHLTCIMCFQPVGGQVHSGDKIFNVPDIVGFSAEYTSEHSGPRVAGSGGPVPSQGEKWTEGTHLPNEETDLEKLKPFDADSTVRFDIDGPGGEVITEVHVSHDSKAIKLRTNRERECFFGEERRSDWVIKRAGPGEMIVGFSMCFGTVGGRNWKTNMSSHWKMSEIGVLMLEVDG